MRKLNTLFLPPPALKEASVASMSIIASDQSRERAAEYINSVEWQKKSSDPKNHPFSAILDLANLTHCFDVFDLSMLVVELGLQKDVNDACTKKEKEGNIEFAQIWLLCVTTAVDIPGSKIKKGWTPKGISLDAKKYLDENKHKDEVPRVREFLLHVLTKCGDDPMKILRAMRKLSISERSLMDDDLREVLIATTEEVEVQLRAAGMYEEGPEKEEMRAALSNTSRKPTCTLRHPSRRVLMEWGAYVLSKGAKPGPDEKVFNGDVYDDVAEELVRVSYSPRKEVVSEKVEWMFEVAVNVATIGAMWAACGFPQVVPSHKLAAALMATDPPPNADGVHLPWPSFAVVVPNGLLDNREPNEVVDCVGITTNGVDLKPVVWIGRKANGLITATAFMTIDDLFKCESDEPEIELLMRLLVGVILEMDSPTFRQTVRESGTARRKEKRGVDKPAAWTFELKRDIKVDCRQWAKDFVSSGGKSPSVRSLTRGHQKRQPYGPRNALRKWIHIEPYWRGPLDGPVAVKSHMLGG